MIHSLSKQPLKISVRLPLPWETRSPFHAADAPVKSKCLYAYWTLVPSIVERIKAGNGDKLVGEEL